MKQIGSPKVRCGPTPTKPGCRISLVLAILPPCPGIAHFADCSVRGLEFAAGSPRVAQGEAGEPETLDVPSTPRPGRSPGATTTESAPETRSILDTLVDGGIVGLLIGLLSVVAVGFIIEHFLTIRKSTLMPEHVADELEELIHKGKINEAIEYCSDPQDDSLISDVVLAGLRRYQSSEFGFAEYKAAVEEAGEDQTGRLYRKTEVLGVIGSIAPMLGLTGTVLGMIKAFNKIAMTQRRGPSGRVG